VHGDREGSGRARLIASLAANSRWAKEEDRSAATQAARDGLQRRFEDQVDPDRTLPADERAKRADSARRAHFQRLALKSAQARRTRKAAKGGGRTKDRLVDGT
jgi:hypothetical protein